MQQVIDGRDEMRKREIILAKLSSGKTIPILIVDINGKLIGLQLRQFLLDSKSINVKGKNSFADKNGIGKYEVNIGHPEGLKSESVVSANRIIILNDTIKVKTLTVLEFKLYHQVIEKYEKFKVDLKKKDNKQKLHKELQELNVKIELCKFNNEKYDVYFKRRNEVLKALGYSTVKLKKRKGTRRSLDYVEPLNKGYIKLYRF